MELGDRYCVVGEIDLHPHTLVMVGEFGTVEKHDADGTVWIKLDSHHKGLCEYENCIWLMPPYTDEEVLSKLAKVSSCLDAAHRVIVPFQGTNGTKRRRRTLGRA